MSIPKTQYFEAQPAVASRPRTVRLRIGEMDLTLQTDRGVFGSKGVDLGTRVLLREAPPPPQEGDVLELGCGYGPIASVVAKLAPGARAWAVDGKQRAPAVARASEGTAGGSHSTGGQP